MAERSVVDEVISLMPQRSGVRPWWERVDAGQAAMLAEILAAWKGGALGTKRRPVSRAISAALKQHGIEIGEQGVDMWLRQQQAK